MMVAAGTYEDILAIVLYGAAKQVAFGEVEEDAQSPGVSVGWTILQVLTGFVLGVLWALVGYFFKYI